MKIVTWNVERLAHKKDRERIESLCSQADADILVLTETDTSISLNYDYCYHTPTPPDLKMPQYNEPLRYRPSESRVAIYTNYRCVRQHTTFDPFTALCVELETELGNLLVYGTIIGVLGNREASFQQDLQKQCADFQRLSETGTNLCICGDYNCTFADNYYYTEIGRETLLRAFSNCGIRLLTGGQPECIDHIAVSEKAISGAQVTIEEWNHDKRLSDHKGIATTIGWNEDA